MPTYTSYIALQKGMEVYVQKALEIVATNVFEKWKGMIKSRVYEQNLLRADPNNSMYERTFELLDSLTLKVSGNKAEIYYDTDKINASSNSDRWNTHMSFSGEDYSALIPLFVEMGQSSRVYSYEGVGVFEDIIDMLNSSYDDMLRSELKKLGVTTN